MDGKVIKAMMQGIIIRIPIKVGDKVEKGKVVIALEAMKMIDRSAGCGHRLRVLLHVARTDSPSPVV